MYPNSVVVTTMEKTGLYKHPSLDVHLPRLSIPTDRAYILLDRTSGGSVRLIPAELLVELQSEKQLVQVVETQDYGQILLLDGQIQLASVDEYIYHETLVHPAISELCRQDRDRQINALILGGGDCCVLRECLMWENVVQATVVDHDLELVELLESSGLSKTLGTNEAIRDPRARFVPSDVAEFIRKQRFASWDLIIMDLTDDWDYQELGGHGKLEILSSLLEATRSVLRDDGAVSIQLGPAEGLGGSVENALRVHLVDTFSSLTTGKRISAQGKVYQIPMVSFGENWLIITIIPNPAKEKGSTSLLLPYQVNEKCQFISSTLKPIYEVDSS